MATGDIFSPEEFALPLRYHGSDHRRAHDRSVAWLLLAVAGPLGLTFIAALRNRAPASEDLYQQIIPNLKLCWRISLEMVAFVCIWTLAFLGMMVAREAITQLASLRTGTPVEAIVAIQVTSSGMHAFAEGLQVLYLVPLLYLLWPVVFNVAGRLFRRSTTMPSHRAASEVAPPVHCNPDSSSGAKDRHCSVKRWPRRP